MIDALRNFEDIGTLNNENGQWNHLLQHQQMQPTIIGHYAPFVYLTQKSNLFHNTNTHTRTRMPTMCGSLFSAQTTMGKTSNNTHNRQQQ